MIFQLVSNVLLLIYEIILFLLLKANGSNQNILISLMQVICEMLFRIIKPRKGI